MVSHPEPTHTSFVLPAELARQLKSIAALRGEAMSDIVAELIKRLVNGRIKL